MSKITTKTTPKWKRAQPDTNEMIFQTRRLRRDLHTRLHVLKATLNGQRYSKDPAILLDDVLNDVIEKGLVVVEKQKGLVP